MQTLGKYHELQSNMLDNEDYIVANIKEKDPAKKEAKVKKWFMFNEVATTPLHPSNFLPDQNDTLNSLTNLDKILLLVRKTKR